MFTSFKQTFHSLFTFHRTMRYLSTLFSRFIPLFAVGYNILSFSIAVARRKMWDGLYISGDCIPWLSVMYIESVHRAKLASVCRVSEAPKMSVFTMSPLLSLSLSLWIWYRLDAATFLTRDNNPTGRSRPGDWITLMIQMSSFLIQRITDGGGGSSWQFSECSWSRSRHRSGAEAGGSPQDLSILRPETWSITKHQSVSDIRSGAGPRQYLYHE